MADDLYTLRAKWNNRKLAVERKYAEKALSIAGTPIRGFLDEAKASGEKINKGGRQIGEAEFRAQQGDLRGAAKYLGSGLLNAAAGTFNAALSPVTGAVSSLVPDVGFTDYMVETFGDNPVVQDAVKLAQENPMATEGLFNALDIAGIKGAGKGLGKAFNAIAENTPTKVPGFYDSPSPLNKAWATAKASVPNFGYAARQGFVPSAAAERRVIGTGQGRRDEYVTKAAEGARGANEVRGNALASPFINSQIERTMGPNTNTVVGNAAEVQRYAQDWFDMSDTKRVRENLTSYMDAPKKVVDAAMEHLPAVHKVDASSPNKTALVVRKPQSGEGLTGEGFGSSRGATPVSALTSESLLKIAKESLEGASDLEFYTDFVSNAKHANAFNIRRAVTLDELPKSYVGEGGVEKSELMKAYYKSLAKQEKGKKLTKNQQQVIDFFSKAGKARLTDRGDGLFTFADSYASTAQDLGGVNVWVAIDSKNNKVYTMTSDGHDMFGMDPAGGTSLVNVHPMQSFDLGTKTKLPEGEGSGSMDLTKIEELTGIERKKKESAKEFAERVGEPRVKGENIDKYEKRVGVKRYKDDESDTAYQARVLRDYKGDPTLKDYMNVGGNIARTGMLASQFNTAKPEEK